ncbi:MAG: type II secretion system protein [Deltaproteobacteria bacterium]|nr:type II secretion system protein [Deltaproteobacteria bacterium]
MNEIIMLLKDIYPSKNGRFTPYRISGTHGFTFIELLVVIIVLGIIASIAVGTFQFYTKKAYNITIMHDLNSFVKAQYNYNIDYQRYLGATGDFIEAGNPPTGTLSIPEFKFKPSEGVRIEIISGDGANPNDPGSPFKAQASHKKSKAKCIYDFSTSQTIVKDE